jgi:hypothetical protein
LAGNYCDDSVSSFKVLQEKLSSKKRSFTETLYLDANEDVTERQNNVRNKKDQLDTLVHPSLSLRGGGDGDDGIESGKVEGGPMYQADLFCS